MLKKDNVITAGILIGAAAALLILVQPATTPITEVNVESGASTVLGSETAQFTSISVDEFNRNSLSPDVVILDVRTTGEYDAGHIEGAINLNYYAADFADQLIQLDKSADYHVYCSFGNLSGQALVMMRDLGFTDVQDLAGGITSWQNAGLAVSDCVNC